ncbi:MAG: calcium-translocating P-type ATPase, SERCA-type [Nanoarchaeota archaeon]|nr:calcium-translocating P-type ATPase, SERCA-type [Nanoarchaeota archaeon]
MEFYRQKLTEVYKNLNSTDKGLTSEEAEKRLEKYGFNEIAEKKKISPFQIFIGQFKDPLVIILIFATIVSSGVGYYEFLHDSTSSLLSHFVEAIVIGCILILNSVIGFFTEFNAQKSIEALKKLSSLKAMVLRDGRQTEIEARALVPGDILILSEGERIPADSRLFEAIELNTQEAALTGESLPVKKELSVYNKELPLGDRKNMVFSGTAITNGKGKAIVVNTGMTTEIGHIAKLIQEAEDEMTPLQKNIEHLGKFLTKLVLGICVVIFAMDIVRGESIIKSFIFAIGLAVAAVPEGLPAVVTISLSLGVRRMIKRHALIRRLPSVETLGCTTVICSDKTGTLTHNEMTVKKVYVDHEEIDVAGSGYDPTGEFSKNTEDLELLMQIGALNNDSKLEKKDNEYKIMGDPTEGALLVSARKHGIDETFMERNMRVDEIPFNSQRKMMTTLHEIEGKKYAYVKGAPDILMKSCTRLILKGKMIHLNDADRKRINKAIEDFGNNALRVLGFAYKEVKSEKREDWEKDLVFVGLQGMIDPPRKEVKDSIAKCKDAGIKVVMITGDFITTAKAIADELGIVGKAITGEELKKINLDKEVENIGIYARVNPEDKMRIVEALQKKAHVVAMTGDGVNDAPALKKSDIGISMGITGTDVAKEASDMVLTDDNFTSIVNAVEEGRTIFDNIRKFVVYLLSSNIGEVLVALVSLVVGLKLPVTVPQLLWINLVTDGAPATALSVDPGEKNIMRLKPRKSTSKIMEKNVLISMIIIGVVMTIATLCMYIYALKSMGWVSGDISDTQYRYASTIAFTTLMMLQMFNVLNARSQRDSVFKVGIFSNRWLIIAILTSIVLQLGVIYIPFFAQFFRTAVLSFADWGLIVLVSSSVLVVGELMKAVGLKQTE